MVTDIAPVQSIAARVMAGLGEPDVILPPGASPHGYALRPSEARHLQAADLVVWVGPDLTPSLADPISALAPDADLVTLADAPGMEMLPVRSGLAFETHADADADDGHEHGDHEYGDDGHGDDGHDHAEHGAHDGHLWLDPENAVAAARVIAAALGRLDPDQAAAYAANADAFAAEMADLSRALAEQVAPVRGTPFLVFHDAYQYFEHRFGIPATASVSLQEGVPPGTARVAGLRDTVRRAGIVCAFSEPQFEPKLLVTILEGTGARTGVLDPLGTALPPGPGLYPALLQGLADGLTACLAG